MFQRWLLLLVLCSGRYALLAQVDQEHWVPDRVSASFDGTFGLQQEFTPALDSLDTVELWIPGAGILNPYANTSGSTGVRIREGEIDGPIIATSDQVMVPALYSGGSVVLKFSTAVPLRPGGLYMLEPFGEGIGTVIGATHPPFDLGYPSGRLYFNGSFQALENFDLIFREGIGIPEPSALVLLGFGLVLLMSVIGRASGRSANQP